MEKKKINQQYIANLVGVSRVTVTKAMQDHEDIALETRKRIQKVAAEVGYVPSTIGRSLVNKSTKTIGIVFPKINHSFFSSVTEQMYATAEELGYRVILMVSFEDKEREQQAIRTLISMQVDGIIIDTAVTDLDTKVFDIIKKNQIPFIFFDRKIVGINDAGIYFQDYDLSFQLTTELINKGYTNMLYLSGSQNINIGKMRLNGFTEGMHSRNLPVHEDRIITTELTEESGYEAFKGYLKKHKELPEVVLCVNDSTALGVYRACEEANIRIPEDLGVVGFGDTAIARLTRPRLSSVKLNSMEAAKKTVRNLIYLIKNSNGKIQDEFFSGSVIFRDSVKENVYVD
ncbi:LacI family DNA-binding transcriptional regulator [Persicobacter psychrovividus]|uniref:LacI family transcriptional regulator n=1 Tax=Persicobacter psychrovividus TaxID=387638 RepID=A0ABM7VDA1_9BACT|nr:LacI family transcriptional regulator [Persicobacter psychrovividus]